MGLEECRGGCHREEGREERSQIRRAKCRESHKDGKRGMMGNSSGIIEAPAELAALGCRKTSWSSSFAPELEQPGNQMVDVGRLEEAKGEGVTVPLLLFLAGQF